MSTQDTTFQERMKEIGIFFSDNDCEEIEAEWQSYQYSLEYSNVLFFQAPLRTDGSASEGGANG